MYNSNMTKPRLPQGQIESNQWVAMPPIHSTYPETQLKDWRLKLYGLVEKPMVINYQKLSDLGLEEFTIDFHCVTRWSKLGQSFTGVKFAKILSLAKLKSSAKFAIFEGDDVYTTNLNLTELKNFGDVFVAVKMDNLPIPVRFGGPVRAIVPQLYGWKSCKFLAAIRFTESDEPGFWETRGYHNHGDPWSQERYSF